jgi:CBS domain-containing protein
MMTIEEIMTTEPYTISPKETVYNARLLMQKHDVRHIPVVDKNNIPVGVITFSDVLAASESSLHEQSEDSRTALEKQHRVREVMTAPVATVDENDSLRSAALHLLDTKHGCLPVTKEGGLIGIITDSDFVDVAVNLMEIMEQQTLESDSFD